MCNEQPKPKLRLTDRKRIAIIGAAAHEFRAHGFQATSIDRIATRAGVSKRTVYHHFASKEELFKAIVSTLQQQVLEATVYPYAPGISLDEQLEAIAFSEAELLASEDFMTLVRATLAECIRSPEFACETMQGMKQGQSGLETWIAAAAADGKLTVDDPTLAASQFMALIKSELFWAQVIGGQPPPEEPVRRHTIRAAIGMFLDHYGS